VGGLVFVVYIAEEKKHTTFPYRYCEVYIKDILDFLVDNIYVVFGDQVFQQ
jgi:hypothetical protein